MRETIERMFASLREFFAKMPRRNKIRMAILAAFVVVLSIVVVSLLTRTVWVPIPNTGDINETREMYNVLRGIGIRARMDMGIIEVPDAELENATMQLYERGYIGTPGFDYSPILEDASTFGISSQQQQKIYEIQTNENIRKALMLNRRITNALVDVKFGESSPFRIATNTRQATAAVTLKLNNSDPLTNSEAQAIGDIVRNSVPGIEIDNITITDQELRSYKLGEEGQSYEEIFDQRVRYQNILEEQANNQIRQIITPLYGPENIQVQADIILNFDRVVINKVEWDPPIPGEEGGIVRSSEEIYRRTRTWANAEGIPGTDPNGLGTVEYPFGDLDGNDVYYESIVGLNYEINRTQTDIIEAGGTIERFSISVLINSLYLGEDVEDAPQYPDEVRQLVATAIGVSSGNVTVQYLPFQYFDTTMDDWLRAQEEREARERMEKLRDQIFMYGTILALAVMVMLLVRTVVKTLRPPPEPEMVLTADGPGIGVDLLVGDDEQAEREYEEIDLNAKSSGLEQIERFIDKDPASVAQLLRNWLSDE